MPFIPKAFQKYPPNTTTPVNPAALAALEQRTANYVGAQAIGPGVGSFKDLTVTAGAGLVLSVGAINALNVAIIPLDAFGGTERYELQNGAIAATVTVNTADVTNPRIDQVIASAPPLVNGGASDSQAPVLSVLQGTATAGATLANRNGAAALPARAIRLADILVPANSVALTTAANVFDRRQQPYFGTTPMPADAGGLTKVDQVLLLMSEQLSLGAGQSFTPSSTNWQIATPVFLPRRINASVMHWAYVQGGTALTGAWNWGLMDASGVLIAATGAQAFLGAANSLNPSSAVVALGQLEAGWYLQVMGLQTLAGGSVSFIGGSLANASSQIPGQALAYSKATGGTTFAATLAAMGLVDTYSVGAVAAPPMPHCNLQ